MIILENIAYLRNTLWLITIMMTISYSISKNNDIKYYTSTYSENIQNILGSKSMNPIAQRDKLKSKSSSWHCDTCHDTNSFIRKDKTKKWMLSISLDDAENLNKNLGDYRDEHESGRRSFNDNCIIPNNTQIQTIPDYGHYLVLSIIPTKVIFSIFWFLLGVMSTVIAKYLVMQYMEYMRKYIDRFIKKLEEQCLLDYRNGLYVNVIHTLVRNIPYVINYRGAKHVDTALFQHLLAKAYLQLGNMPAAESLLQSVRAIYEPLGRDVHLANVLEDLGTVNYANNSFEDALDFYITALDIHVDLLASSTAEVYLNPSIYKHLSGNSPKGATVDSSKYEQKYRRHLVRKALSEAKELTAKSPRTHGYRVVSPDGSDMTGFESPGSSIKSPEIPIRSLSDSFELELESDPAVRELESLLASPECVEVSPISENLHIDSSENIVESCLLSSASGIPASPDTIRLHHLIGKVLCKQKRFPSAIEYLSVALDMLTAMNGSPEDIQEMKNDIESVSQIFKFRASTGRGFSSTE